jgi:DoxX-like protein
MNVSPLVVAVPVAVVFAALGVMKILALPPMRVRAAHLGFSVPAYRAIGTLEIAGAAGVVLGVAAPVIGGLAGAGLLLLLAGALVAHLRNGDSPSHLVPAVVAGLLVAAYLVVLPGATP